MARYSELGAKDLDTASGSKVGIQEDTASPHTPYSLGHSLSEVGLPKLFNPSESPAAVLPYINHFKYVECCSAPQNFMLLGHLMQ
jgi:hypothetical protein